MPKLICFFLLLFCFSERFSLCPAKRKPIRHLDFHSSLQDLDSCQTKPSLEVVVPPLRNRSHSLPGLLVRWICVHCHFFNTSVTFSCAACGTVDLPSKQNFELNKLILLRMASSVSSREGNTTWHVAPPKTFYNDENNKENKWDATVLEENECSTSVEGVQQNENEKEEGGDQPDGAPSRSPKRHSQSVYERVKSKVSRSLSNGSVVQKLWMDSSSNSMIPKSIAGGGLFRRPTSMVDNASGEEDVSDGSKASGTSSINDNIQTSDEVNKNTDEPGWSCSRCTLDNASTSDRCEVCETPRKTRVPLLTATGPRNSLVISVPNWVGEEVKEAPPAPTHAIQPSSRNNIKSPAWNKPVNRRSLSEMPNSSNSSDQSKPSSNRRSMIETDAQGNISVRSPLNNVNLQGPSRTRFSYIGLTEPSASPTEVSRVVRKRILPALAADGISAKADDIVLPSTSSPPPLATAQSPDPSATSDAIVAASEISGLALKRMWTCTKCSYAYNPLWSDKCDICDSVRSPPSVNEPSLITVTKDSVRYTPTKQDGEPSPGDTKVPAPGAAATLATEETDLEDEIEVKFSTLDLS